MGVSLPPEENPGNGGLSPWAAVEPVAAIAPSFPGAEAITSWRRFWNGCVPKRSVWGTVGMGVPLHGQEAPCREPGTAPAPLGTGCHLEGQAASCSGTPTRLGWSHLNSCFGFFVAIFLLLLLLLLLKNQSCARAWAGLVAGHGPSPRGAEPHADSVGSPTGAIL